MGTRSTLAGKEVPIIGSDAVRWIELSVTSSSNISVDGGGVAILAPPTTDDRASCFVAELPSSYLIWRIHKTHPRALELLELNASKEFPKLGLRFNFPHALCPFVFICKNEITTGNSIFPYLIYVLTVSGVAYLLKIRNVSAYASSSSTVFPVNDVLELSVRDYIPNNVTITAMAATAGCLVIGRSDGSICCFQLGGFDPSAPGFMQELRDEAGISRLWGLMSRGKPVGTVQDMVISELYGKRFVFVLHLDGTLRIWDLASHSRVFNHTMAGATFLRFWVGQSNPDSSTFLLAILYRHTLDENLETISLHRILHNFGDRVFSIEPSVHNFPLDEGRCLDVKLTMDKIWILKDDELVSHVFSTSTDEVEAFSYALQEEFVADQLFQSSEHLADEIFRIAHSVFSSSKDDMVPFVSSIFLFKLLLPGVHHNAALCATLTEYGRHWVESELRTLTADGLKKEILSVIEHEVTSEKVSILHCWKCFFTCYFHNWCKSNALYGLLVDFSAGAVGLIRKSSISLFRSLEDIERILEGSSDEVGVLTGLVDLFDDDLDCEILIELLRCVINFSQQLGKPASSIFYESFLTAPVISSEDIIRWDLVPPK